MEVSPVLLFIVRFLFYFDVTCPYIFLTFSINSFTKDKAIYLIHFLPCLVLVHAEKGNCCIKNRNV